YHDARAGAAVRPALTGRERPRPEFAPEHAAAFEELVLRLRDRRMGLRRTGDRPSPRPVAAAPVWSPAIGPPAAWLPRRGPPRRARARAAPPRPGRRGRACPTAWLRPRSGLPATIAPRSSRLWLPRLSVA